MGLTKQSESKYNDVGDKYLPLMSQSNHIDVKEQQFYIFILIFIFNKPHMAAV